MTTSVRHYHHKGQRDDLVIVGYLYEDPSTGVVLVTRSDVVTAIAKPASVSELEPWPTEVGP